MLTTIMVIVGIFAIFGIWFNAMRANEAVRKMARHFCQRRNLQLLDDTCALKRIRLRSRYGKLAFYREYQFEYTEDFSIRKRAKIGIIGDQVEFTEFDLPSTTTNPNQTNKDNDPKIKKHR